jgi:hypothetical protein
MCGRPVSELSIFIEENDTIPQATLISTTSIITKLQGEQALSPLQEATSSKNNLGLSNGFALTSKYEKKQCKKSCAGRVSPFRLKKFFA